MNKVDLPPYYLNLTKMNEKKSQNTTEIFLTILFFQLEFWFAFFQELAFQQEIFFGLSCLNNLTERNFIELKNV